MGDTPCSRCNEQQGTCSRVSQSPWSLSSRLSASDLAYSALQKVHVSPHRCGFPALEGTSYCRGMPWNFSHCTNDKSMSLLAFRTLHIAQIWECRLLLSTAVRLVAGMLMTSAPDRGSTSPPGARILRPDCCLHPSDCSQVQLRKVPAAAPHRLQTRCKHAILTGQSFLGRRHGSRPEAHRAWSRSWLI